MPNDTIKTYPDLIAAILPLLTKSGPDAPEVVALVQQGKTQFPEHAAEIDRLVAPTAPQASGTWAGLAKNGGMLTAGVLAASLYAYSDVISDAIAQLHLSVTTTWGLLAVIVVFGAIGGFLNGYIEGSGLILPRVHVISGKATFFPGFLGNVATGALTAAATVWLASPAESPAASTPSATATPAAAPANKNLLTPAILISAFVAGFGGSRVATGQRDKNLLMAAAQSALSRPTNIDASKAFGAARSTLEAFTIATGTSVAGAASAPAGTAAADADLQGLLDKSRLNNFFAVLLQSGSAPVLRRDGAGLPLDVLPQVQALAPPLRDAVKDLRLVGIAGVPFDLFKTSVPVPPGTDASTFNVALSQIWDAARVVKNKLDQMPADWVLKP